MSSTKDFPGFLRALYDLLPFDSVLYIEGGRSSEDDVKAFLESHSANEEFKIPGGTVFVKTYHTYYTGKS